MRLKNRFKLRPASPPAPRDWTTSWSPRDWADLPTFHPLRDETPRR